jgi:malate dehydrogenase (oxaloacetate-decarboxylating)
MPHEKLVRTVRVRTRRKVGNLGVLTTALGDAGASIGEIVTVKLGHNYTIRDFNLFLNDEDHLHMVLRSVDSLSDSDVIEVRDRVRAVHSDGKISTVSRVPIRDVNTMRTVYMPGVQEIVQLVDDDPSSAELYTGVGRTVAVVSNGAGLLGVGKVKPAAMLPMLEGKAAILAEFAGLSALPLALEVQEEGRFVDSIASLAPSCGAVLLDGIPTPRGTQIQKRLDEALSLPVFHDDADSPAVVGLAAVFNAVKRAEMDLDSVTIGQVGLGTAGGAIARLIMATTGRPVWGEDIHPEAVNRHVALGGRAASLDEIMKTCDVVVANTGHGDVIPPSLVREGQAIIALSEPYPEIETYEATLAGARFAADGKAVHKAVVFPGTLLGAMTVKAKTINDDMRVAAARTLADHAEEGDLVPTPLTEHVHAAVAGAVARAAVESGVAGREVDDDDVRMESFAELIAQRQARRRGH